MKIIYISNSIIPSRFANSVNVMKMCQAFSKNGHEVVLYAREGKRFDAQVYKDYNVKPQFRIIRSKFLPTEIISNLVHIYNVVVDIKKKPMPDIFYSRVSYGLFVVSSLGIPMIYESHKLPGIKILKIIEKKLFSNRNFLRLVVISKALKNDYKKTFPFLPDDKIVVAHDGADLPYKDKLSTDFEEIEGLIPNNHNLNVGYTGHLYRGRGIEIIASLANELPQFNFHVVGGMNKDIIKWKSIYKMKNLIFHGFVPHSEINSYIKKFDIVLAPYQNNIYTSKQKTDISRWISPMKLFEYMAAGKPIIVSDINVFNEVLINNVNAIMVKPDDLEAWKNAILKLSSDKNQRIKLGQEAKKNLIQNYTWTMRAIKVLNQL